MAPQRDVHIAPGPSAGGCLNQVLRPASGALLWNHDVLSCGPLVAVESLGQWQRLREDYLRSIRSISYPDLPEFSFASSARDLLTGAHTLLDAETVTLWIGTGLAEQLLLA